MVNTEAFVGYIPVASAHSCTSYCDRKQWMFRYPLQKLQWKDLINVLPADFPGLEKSIIPPFSYAHLFNAF